MPWRIEKKGEEFCVIKEDDDENEGCHPTREKAEAQMRALYSSENREEIPERAPIETRSATVGAVDYPQRTIEVIAVPYDQEALVEYRGELWRESFDRGSFDGVEKRPNRIKAYRDHDAGEMSSGAMKRGLVGKATALFPEREDGLMGKVRIAKTNLGDETLSLADEGVLGVSVGFAARPSDQVFNRSTMRRRIRKAFLDHIAFPDEGAYAGAQVVGVRTANQDPSGLPKLDTPRIDEVVAWLESRRRI
jgi:phage head maturation protease